jgi:hypothetical protein
MRIESGALSTTNPTWRNLWSNPDYRGVKPATNGLSHDTAIPEDTTPQDHCCENLRCHKNMPNSSHCFTRPPANVCTVNVFSHVGVTYKTGFWIGWLHLLLLIHSHNSRVQAIQRYRYSTHIQFTVPHSLGFYVFIVVSWQRIYQVSLSLQLTREVFFAPPNSSLAISSQSTSTAISRTRLSSLDYSSVLRRVFCVIL